ncbi:MAG: class I SAM-dependent rRNA methyltransferase [Acidobacteria bacterium]|nr:class I SAM-dependent rRNA methyltransferase [Acidobacteriota bacterium]
MPSSAVIHSRGAERWRSGHPWIYQSDVLSVDADPGDLVEVKSERGRPLGRAFFSSTSQITLRMLGEGPRDERALFAERLEAAMAYRTRVAQGAQAYRLVNAEADRIPSLIVDRYGDVLVVQTLSQGTDARLDLFIDLLQTLVKPAGILVRNDPKVRALEGLESVVEVRAGTVPDLVDVVEGDIAYQVDVRHGQKTGLFLDQRENHLVAGAYASGRGLDAFSYHGGFALQMARHCDSVLALDGSEPAIAALSANAKRNGLSNVEARVANVFDELRELEISKAKFDTIVLDPPAFAKTKASLPKALGGYKEINLRALKLLRPGGILISCTCSYHVSEPLFLEVLERAAADALAPVVLVEKRLQARDHPVLLGVPETAYLKCLVLRRL